MEINIKKKKNPVWPWIVAILVILAILFFLYTQYGDEVEEQINNNQNNETSYVQPADDVQLDVVKAQDDIAYYDEVKDFISFVEFNQEETPQNYTEKATIYLAQALNKMVDLEHVGDAAIEAKREALMLTLEAIKNDSSSAQHPQMISLAFTQSAELMTAMQRKDYPALQPQIKNVENIAKSIQPGQLLAERLLHEKEFFLLTKVALKAISEIDTF